MILGLRDKTTSMVDKVPSPPYAYRSLTTSILRLIDPPHPSSIPPNPPLTIPHGLQPFKPLYTNFAASIVAE